MGSAFLWGFKYVRVLNFQDCQYARVLNFEGYTELTYVVNMTGFWIWAGKQLRKGSEYSRIPNMPDFCICKRHTRFWICLNMAEYLNKLFWPFWLWQVSEYTWSKFQRILNMPPILNMLGLGICQGWEDARVAKGAEYASRMPQ